MPTIKREEKVLCRTPTPGKKGTNIPRERFDVLRKAILAVVPKTGDGLRFSELPDQVDAKLSAKQREIVGSIMWNVTTVKLELEVRGEIVRAPGRGPQRLLRTSE